MKPLIGTLLLALVLFLSSIDYSSTTDRQRLFPGFPNSRTININLDRSDSRHQENPASQTQKNIRGRKGKILAPPLGESSNNAFHVPILESNPLHPHVPYLQFHKIDPVKQKPEEFPVIRSYRDPAHAHLDIDLNRFPSPEAFAHPQQRIYRPIARYPDANYRVPDFN